MTITYELTGRIDQVRFLPDASARTTDNLWRHTCFEFFVGAQNDAEYYEFNFSASGQWAVYEFRDYRDGTRFSGDGMDPKIAVQKDPQTLRLNAVVRFDDLPGLQSEIGLRLGVSAVIEDLNGSRSYWALKHPPGRPDFHHADNFVLQIEPTLVDRTAADYTGHR